MLSYLVDRAVELFLHMPCAQLKARLLTNASETRMGHATTHAQVCGVKMTDSELLDVMQEARATDGTVSSDTLTRLLLARANALRAAAAAGPGAAARNKKRYTSVPAVDHTEMRQEWVPYRGGGAAGGRPGHFENDDVFYRGALCSAVCGDLSCPCACGVQSTHQNTSAGVSFVLPVAADARLLPAPPTAVHVSPTSLSLFPQRPRRPSSRLRTRRCAPTPPRTSRGRRRWCAGPRALEPHIPQRDCNSSPPSQSYSSH